MQIAKYFGGELLRINTALATYGHLLQQKAFVENFYTPNHFLNSVPFKKIQAKSHFNQLLGSVSSSVNLEFCFFLIPIK